MSEAVEERPEVMPAGAIPPEQKPEPEPEPEKILGKFNAPEEVYSAYSELEKKLGEQGGEVGSLKKMNQMLMEQLQQKEGQAKTPPTDDEVDDFDYDLQMQELTKAVEEGDLDISEALLQSSKLAAEQATRQSLSKYEEMSQQRAIEQTQQQFLQTHPDFMELKQTGQLESVKQTLPGLHDDFSAYYALKAEQAQAAAEQRQETERIATGDVRTDKVLQKPGTPQTKNIGRKQGKMSDYELKQSMLARLSA